MHNTVRLEESKQYWSIYLYAVGRIDKFYNGHKKEESWSFELESTEVSLGNEAKLVQ